MSKSKLSQLPLIVGILSLFLFVIFACASSELTRFKKNIKTMSNAGLLNCYYGINERTKDIDNKIIREDRLDYEKNQDVISQQTYFVGGEAYGLMQKEKLVLEELKRRNIEP
jgi:hypothetical protein